MFVINAIFKCKEGKREFLRDKIREEGIDTASRSEDGNYKYDFFMSTENPTDLLIVEFWKDVDTWKNHRTLPHYQRLEELKKETIDGVEVHKYFSIEE